MILSIAAILKLILLVGLVILIVQSIFYVHKIYKFIAYKNAEIASEKYLESRLLVGIKGKDISKIAKQLDDYLNDVIGVDLNEDELICIVESKIWRTLHDNKINNKSINLANVIANALNNTSNANQCVEYCDNKNDDSIYKEDIYTEVCDSKENEEEYHEIEYNKIIGGM